MRPLVSVIMPVFNAELYVEDAARSALAQTEGNIELIIVDDGSTDNTLALVSRLAVEDSRIQVHRQAHSGKASIARNAGIAYARGPFIAFLDGDDLYHPRLVERALHAFAQVPDAGLVFSDYAFFSGTAPEGEGNLRHLRLLEIASGYVEHVGDSLYRCDRGFYKCLSTRAFGAVTTLTAVVRRELLELEPIWFAEDLVTYEDNDLWLRLALRSRFAYIDEVLAYYRRHAGNTTSNAEKMMLGAIVAKTRNLARGAAVFSPGEVKWCRGALSQHYFSLGYLRASRNDTLGALKSYMSAARLCPTSAVFMAILKTLIPNKLLRVAQRMRDQ